MSVTPTILYIIGEGRSGSTLLDMLLGQVDGFESVGELHFIWSRGLRDNQSCGCAEKFSNCEFWGNVLKQFELNNTGLSFEELAQLTSIDSMKKFPGNYFADKFFSNNKIQKVFESYDSLYMSIAEVTGANVIVDSSKSVPYAYFLAKYSKLDIRFIHMVRDSRAVTFSRQKKKIRKEVTDHVEYMPVVSSWKSSFKWLSNNMLVSKIIGNRPCIRIVYESLVSSPCATLCRFSDFLSLPKEKFEKIVSDDNTASMSIHHTVSGNPSRFNTGIVKIKVDDRWRSEMPFFRKYLVTILTWPLLRKYYNK